MALTELANGTLLDAPVLNGNFNYLDDKIDSSVTTINASISSTNSALATVNSSISGGSLVPAGTVIMFAGSNVPTGYLLCNGSSKSKTTYPSLFAAIGYSWGGSGDNFNVPLLTDGRFLKGASSLGYQDYTSVATSTKTSTATTSWNGDHTHTVRKPTSTNEMQSGTAGGHNHSVTTTYTDAWACNPKNIGLLPCIKY